MSNIRDAHNLDETNLHLAGDLANPTYVTYIRPVVLEDKTAAFGVYTEEGVQLAVFVSEEAAYYSARQNNLNPVRVH